MFKKTPSCELCSAEEATAFSLIAISGQPMDGEWKFVGACSNENEEYYIEIERFFKNPPASVDWIAHMHEKSWMNWQSFMDMMTRFRAATNSFGSA